MPLEWTAEGTVVVPNFTPSDLASIWDWWEPSREGLADTDPIATLTGQVAPGAGHNFTQGTLANRPTYKANQLNGLGIADFLNGVDADYMIGVDPSALTAAHLFIVIKADADPPGTSIVPWKFGTSASPDHYPFTDSKFYCGACSTSRRDCTNPAAALTSWRVVEVISTATEYTVKLDGTQLFTSGTNTVGITNSCVLGASSTTGNNPWAGEFAGIYLCSAKLSAGDRTDMIGYLNTRFALSSS